MYMLLWEFAAHLAGSVREKRTSTLTRGGLIARASSFMSGPHSLTKMESAGATPAPATR